MSDVTVFDYIKSINEKTEPMDAETSAFCPRVLDIGLSFFPDTIFYVNEANSLNLTNQMHYDFLYYLIDKRKRFSKWFKKEKDEEILSMISELYDVTIDKAKEYKKSMTVSDLEKVIAIIDKGGKRNK